ncbi:MAG: FtsX-like permease family protein [Cyclobacteriaceae bacterium]
MLAQLAWKNIWRNKIRSLVVITSVMLGLWAGSFIMAYAFGMIEQRLSDAIENEISHIQIHHPDYLADNDPEFFIEESNQVLAKIAGDQRVKAASARVLVYGMINSPTSSAGGKLFGVNPIAENGLTKIGELISEGEYLNQNDRNRIVIGQKLAEKLKVKLRSKVVLTFQDAEKNIVAGAFRIKGIYKSYNSAIEEVNIYLRDQDLVTLLGDGGNHHEIALLLKDPEQTDSFKDELAKANQSLQVETWKELSPELSLMIETLDQSMLIFLIIILIALSFGIINTMLMAVLERVREIGMLMAIGMTKTRLFAMISLETVFMVMIAAPFGLLLAYGTIEYLGTYGLDLSAIYAEGYARYGFKSMIYPSLGADYYLQIMLLVFITAILSAIYPAITALRLNPVTAIRKI